MVTNSPLSRRVFLGGLTATSLLGVPGLGETNVSPISSAYFAAAARAVSGGFVVAILDAAGQVLDQQPLPSRGHGFAWARRSRRLVSFTRRPGWQMLVSTLADTGKLNNSRAIDAAPGRHFYGHGCFSANGRWLFATENHLESLVGMIGVYDTQQGFARVREFPSHGIGPHEMRLSNDGQFLLIANGGIATHPDRGQGSDKGREKLNLDTMRSNVAILTATSGELVAKLDVPDPYQRLSLRHMSEDSHGRLWLGGQYQGDAEAIVPLIMSVDLRDSAPKLAALALPEITTVQLNHYIGSVGYHAGYQRLAFTAPKSDKALFIDPLAAHVPGTAVLTSLVSASGVPTIADAAHQPWPINSLSGQWYRRDVESSTDWQSSRTALVLDNHLTALA